MSYGSQLVIISVPNFEQAFLLKRASSFLNRPHAARLIAKNPRMPCGTCPKHSNYNPNRLNGSYDSDSWLASSQTSNYSLSTFHFFGSLCHDRCRGSRFGNLSWEGWVAFEKGRTVQQLMTEDEAFKRVERRDKVWVALPIYIYIGQSSWTICLSGDQSKRRKGRDPQEQVSKVVFKGDRWLFR